MLQTRIADLQQLASGVLQRAAAAAAAGKKRRTKPEVVIKQEFKTELMQAAMLKARLVC